MKARGLLLVGLAVLLILGAAAWLGIAVFHFWMSSGPPVPQPRDVFFTRAWIDLGVALVLGIGAAFALRYRRAR